MTHKETWVLCCYRVIIARPTLAPCVLASLDQRLDDSLGAHQAATHLPSNCNSNDNKVNRYLTLNFEMSPDDIINSNTIMYVYMGYNIQTNSIDYIISRVTINQTF